MNENLVHFKNYFNKNLEKISKNSNVKYNIEVINEFNNEYPIAKIKKLSLKEYIYNIGNQNTFCGKIAYYYNSKEVGPSIQAQAIEGKFGIYYKNHNYVNSDGAVISKPEEYYKELKKQLVEVLTNISKGIQDVNYPKKYDHLKGMWNFILKLAYYINPDINISFGKYEILKNICKYFGIDTSKDDKSLNLSYRIRKYIDENISESKGLHSSIIGSILWDYYKTFIIPYLKKNKKKRHKSDGNRERENGKPVDNITPGKNIIYYGVPGCGKSFKVNKISKNYDYVVRTVFHPDYTYTDFIGQVMPIIVRKDDISYEFIPGPFTDALMAAKENTNKKVLLIIEEINRGNAAAIFGDIFQLLDRDDNSYKVQNESICSYLRKNKNSNFEDHEFDLPNNLDIIATMNTSDQNVYPLDTAFRRRFSFVRVKNDFDDIDPEDKDKVQELKKKKIAGLNISWENFFSIINKYIISNSNLLLNNEDKRLGAFSVNVNDLSDKRKFADKVLFYLWDNIGKYNPDIFFRESYIDEDGDTVYYKVYDQIIDKYIAGSSTDIFCDDLKNLLDEKIEEKKEQENEK